MKGKLIKRKDRWDLYYDKDISMVNTIASSEDNPKGKLCLKNCESIENGYDLDIYIEAIDYAAREGHPDPAGFSDKQVGLLHGYIDGFQKAIEILGDKNFSRQDVIHALTYGVRESKMGRTHSQILEEYKSIQLLEQKEFDVEIIIETVPTFVAGIQDGFEKKPKLDKNNCFILKII